MYPLRFAEICTNSVGAGTVVSPEPYPAIVYRLTG